jgi:small subunit ribosomal protein S16
MVVVRLSRGGAKKRPFFNIVVTDKRNRRDGSFIERLGFYNPQASEKEKHALRVDLARVEHWKSLGAQVSPTVSRLVRDFAAKGDVVGAASPANAGATETAQPAA